MKVKLWLLITILAISLMMNACGKSAAVKQTEELINAIGDVSINSEETIIEAEEAYNALSDSEKEKVENSDILINARDSIDSLKIIQAEEEAKKRAQEREKKNAEIKAKRAEENKQKEPFIGLWRFLYQSIVSEDLVYNLNGGTVGGAWSEVRDKIDSLNMDDILIDKSVQVSDSTIIFKDEKYNVIEDHGITFLVSPKGTYVKKENYKQAFDDRFVVVSLSSENISQYIGGFKRIGDTLDEWGDKADDLYILTSPAFEQGLIMLTYNDIQYEVKVNNNVFTVYAPYTTFSGWGNNTFNGFGRAEGTITYVRSEYVKEIKEGPTVFCNGYNYKGRTIEFTDGFVYDFFVFDWPKSNADYEALLQF